MKADPKCSFEHGSKGRRPANGASIEKEAKILGPYSGRYNGFNIVRFAEFLREREDIQASCHQVYRILSDTDLASSCHG